MIFFLFIGLFLSVGSYAQTVSNSEERFDEFSNGSNKDDSYFDDFQNTRHYYGIGYELEYSFTSSGYFEYSLTVYPGILNSYSGSRNEIAIILDDETSQTHFEDYLYTYSINSSNVVRTGSFYVGTPASHNFLLDAGYLSADGSNYSSCYGLFTVNWANSTVN